MTPTRPQEYIHQPCFHNILPLWQHLLPQGVCFHNPHCISRRTSFASEKAFTMHCQRFPVRLVYIRDELHGTSATTKQPYHEQYKTNKPYAL